MKTIVLFICTCFIFHALVNGQKLEVEGPIVVGNMNWGTYDPGTIRWNGEDFEGFNGSRWFSLSSNNDYGFVVDREDNIYRTVTIGGMEWMAENLRVRTFNDGNGLLIQSSDADWRAGAIGFSSYAFPDYDSDNEDSYGLLYSGFVIRSNSNICPIGWSVPSRDDWQDLIAAIGASFPVVGALLRSTGNLNDGTGLWINPDKRGMDIANFSILPTGEIHDNGLYFNEGFRGSFWTTTTWNGDPDNLLTVFRVAGSSNGASLSAGGNKEGLAIRCIKK